MKDQYAGFAERYDLPYGLTVDSRLGEFFRKVFAEHRVRRVLDCACGTGRHLLLFRDLGCEVSGSDISSSILTQVRSNLAAAGASIPLRQPTIAFPLTLSSFCAKLAPKPIAGFVPVMTNGAEAVRWRRDETRMGSFALPPLRS